LPKRRSAEAQRPEAARAVLAPLWFLLVAGVLELAINRLAVPLLRPARGAPPGWHTALDYAGLFLFYFASLLGVIVAGLRVARALEAEPAQRRAELATAVPLAALAVLASWAVLVAPSEGVTFALEACLAAVVLVQIGRGAGWFLGQPRDLGITIGVALLAAPLAVHFFAVVGARYWWPEGTYDGIGASMGQASGLALAIAGLASPYSLAPRPFVRSVTRVAPVLVAISVAVVAAMLLRHDYLGTARAIKLAIGVELQTTSADPQLTIYLLALATLSWTIASCALAATAPRRMVAVGLGLLVLGGHAFEWPLHYLLLALGLITTADVATPVRAAERQVPGAGPAIDDATWGRYLGTVSATLRRRCASLHSLTTRSAEGATSSVLVGEVDGRALRIRIDRDRGVVIGLDLAIGRDLELSGRGGGTAATLVVVSDEPYLLEDAPAARPAIASGDAAFDARFRSFGAEAELGALFDASTRSLAVTLLDGWLACAQGQCLRYRSYLRHGGIDPVIPLGDLAQGLVPGGAGERVRVMVELLFELAARAQVRTSTAGIVEGEAPPAPILGEGEGEARAPIGEATATAEAKKAAGDSPETSASSTLSPGDEP
jgi:hypothetical protein